MLTLDDARQRLLSAVEPLDSEAIPLEHAVFRVLARDVRATCPLPPFDASAMDGYALDTTSLAGGPDLRLRVVGESRAGTAAPCLEPGSACRIFTGAPVPRGANAVVIQEEVHLDGDRIELQGVPAAGSHIRRAGEDLELGSTALRTGTHLEPRHLGLLSSLEQTSLTVHRRPRVVILPTGDELRLAGTARRAGSVVESNGLALKAWAEKHGAEVHLSLPVADDAPALARALQAAAATADVVLTIGGVSVGDYDLVRTVLERLGGRLDFWKVGIRPGKPFAFGALDRAKVLGLPGNPVSAQLSFALFGLPLLRKLSGLRSLPPTPRPAILGSAIDQTPGRLGLVRARLSEPGSPAVATSPANSKTLPLAMPLPNQSSGSVSSLAWAEVLILVPAECEHLAAGTRVEVLHLDSL